MAGEEITHIACIAADFATRCMLIKVVAALWHRGTSGSSPQQSPHQGRKGIGGHRASIRGWGMARHCRTWLQIAATVAVAAPRSHRQPVSGNVELRQWGLVPCWLAPVLCLLAAANLLVVGWLALFRPHSAWVRWVRLLGFMG